MVDRVENFMAGGGFCLQFSKAGFVDDDEGGGDGVVEPVLNVVDCEFVSGDVRCLFFDIKDGH